MLENFELERTFNPKKFIKIKKYLTLKNFEQKDCLTLKILEHS